MWRGVSWWLACVTVAALVALAGCSHYWFAEREPWRRDAEVACLNSGAVKESPGRVRVEAISGPGVCGADFPFRVSELGDNAPLGYDDEAIRPPGTIPAGAGPQYWPGMPPPYAPPPPAPYEAAPPSGVSSAPLQPPPTYAAPAGTPLPLTPDGSPSAPSYPPAAEDDAELPADMAHPYPTAAPPRSGYPPQNYSPPPYTRASEPSPGELPPPPTYPPRLGPSSPMAPVGPVAVTPPATLACPIISALDRWVAMAVQPVALHWFHQPVVMIKQISAYSCRGMNGDPNAHISEHAFGNALDIAEFDLADGHRVIVQYGWHGTPEEQGFLRDVQAAACAEFSTVLAPGANIYHYNHIHVDLMRRASGRRICEPAAISGEVVAARARAHYAAQHPSDPGVTGSIKKAVKRALGYSNDEDDRLPLAEPGQD
jgi:hypothetical protein